VTIPRIGEMNIEKALNTNASICLAASKQSNVLGLPRLFSSQQASSRVFNIHRGVLESTNIGLSTRTVC
jgi:hypothetical protein